MYIRHPEQCHVWTHTSFYENQSCIFVAERKVFKDERCNMSGMRFDTALSESMILALLSVDKL